MQAAKSTSGFYDRRTCTGAHDNLLIVFQPKINNNLRLEDWLDSRVTGSMMLSVDDKIDSLLVSYSNQ